MPQLVLAVIVGCAVCQIGIFCTTVYLHRTVAHRALTLAPSVRLVFRVLVWITTGIRPRQWAAVHRKHHAFTDVEGDPHSPHLQTTGRCPRLRGALHAHAGWLLRAPATDVGRWAPDLAGDPDLVMLTRLFPLACAVSLGAPALLGWAISGTGAGALGGLVWGGLVRVFVLQQATFAVNSACHLWGRRPFRTREQDRATNLAVLSVLSMGESWHNAHHASPRTARHGVDRGQLDSTARLIQALERCRLVSQVRWPTPESLDARRVEAGQRERSASVLTRSAAVGRSGTHRRWTRSAPAGPGT